jgi:ribosome-associated protein
MSEPTSNPAPSKTQVKRAMLELQALGDALLELPAAQLAAFELPEPLRQAIDEARRISSHGAKRRQRQYIGRLMRDIDAEPIRTRLAALDGGSRAASARQRQLERWRERLLEDDTALTDFAAAYPGADLQVLRTLIRNARKELAEGRPPRAQRELFRLVRETSEP